MNTIILPRAPWLVPCGVHVYGYTCTRLPGHRGDHVASLGVRTLARWARTATDLDYWGGRR